MRQRGLGTLLALLLCASLPAAAAGVSYASLQPLLQQHCVLCHAGPAAPLELRLDSLDALLKGSRNGPVVRAGDPEGSELLRRLQGRSLPRMPMTGPPWLTEAEIALFERWIVDGLPAGAPQPVAAPVQPAAPAPGAPVTWLQVAPILASRCVKCHAEGGLLGAPPEGYRLGAYAAALDHGERVRIVPGQPQASELLRRIRGQSRPRMPFDGPPWLAEDEIRLIERWIAEGARDSTGQPAPLPVGARLRLHGRLDGRWQLDGLPLQVGPGTRIDRSPAPGDEVEVRARLGADGQVQVERLRQR